eukprot:scaffold10223_cov96-Skeletonema_dohrnii-CCMP3373.AAC.14
MSPSSSVSVYCYCQNGLSFNATRLGPFRGLHKVFEWCIPIAIGSYRCYFRYVVCIALQLHWRQGESTLRSKGTKWLLQLSEVIEIRN